MSTWTATEDVPYEDKSERGLSGGELLAKVVEMTSRRLSQLLGKSRRQRE